MTNTVDSLVSIIADRGLSLLRLTSEQWAEITATRSAGTRFSLTFSHADARVVRPQTLCLIAVDGERTALCVGRIRSIAASATFDTRIVFDLVSEIAPTSLSALLASVQNARLQSSIRTLGDGYKSLRAVSPKLGAELLRVVADDPDNHVIVRRIAAVIDRPRRFTDARALEQNALELALKVFGATDPAVALALPDDGGSALAGVRTLEDAVIEHDARWIPDWTLSHSDLSGRALFRRGGQELEVFTANKRPLEELLGVDLIYYNRLRQALVLVQYKMMEPGALKNGEGGPPERDWLVPIDQQFRDEVARMERFDRDLDANGSYRLNTSAFFFKLVKRDAAVTSAGIVLSLGHLKALQADGRLLGPRGGLRLSYSDLDGHYLRSDAFVELVRSGYVGTRGATTAHMETLITAALNGGRGVVAALQRVIVPVGLVTD